MEGEVEGKRRKEDKGRGKRRGERGKGRRRKVVPLIFQNVIAPLRLSW